MPTDLPPCRFRREPSAELTSVLPAGRHACLHPLVRGPNEFAVINDQFCRECAYVIWDAERMVDGYQQNVDLQPSEDEFADRVETCDACEVRIQNYCPKAGGSCTLARKLVKGSFRCPIGKFGEIER